MAAGIYEIKNTVNGKRYVGSSIHIEKRFKEHLRDLKSKTHHSQALQNAWNFHGENSFSFNVLAKLEASEIKSTEQRLIDWVFENESDNYNSSRSSTSPMHGRRHKESTKQLMAANRCGEKNAFFGKKHTPETIAKLKSSLAGRDSWAKGKTFSEEHKAKLSAAKAGKKPPNFGVRSDVCKNGHSRTSENTYSYKEKIGCRICRNQAVVRYQLKRNLQP